MFGTLSVGTLTEAHKKIVKKRKSASVLSFTAFLASSSGVCGLLLLSGWERRVVWRKVVEGKRRKSGNQKHKSNCNSLKSHNSL